MPTPDVQADNEPLASVAPYAMELGRQANTPAPTQSVKPFGMVDVPEEQARAYEVEAIKGTAKTKVDDQHDAERDKANLQAYIQSGGEGDLYSPDGLNTILHSDWAHKNLSQKGYDNLAKIYGDKATADLSLKKQLADADPDTVKNMQDAMEFNAQYITKPPLDAYDQAKASGLGEQEALDAFRTARAASVQVATNMKDRYGKPMFTPNKLKAMSEANPDEYRHVYGVSDYAMSRTKAEMDARLSQAKETEFNARAERELALAEKAAREESGKSESNIGKLNDDLKAGRITQAQFDKAAAGSGGQLSARESQQQSRMITAANEATADLKNITELPITSSAGVFGSATPGATLFGSSMSVLANKMTTQDVQAYKTTVAGIQRNLAAIEATGLMPSGSLTHQMGAVVYQEGDTNLTKLRKLAQTRQIIEKGLEPLLHNPRVPQETRDYIGTIIDDAKGAVPYSVHDVNEYSKAARKNKSLTPQQFFGQNPAPKGAVVEKLPDIAPEGKVATDNETGDVYKGVDGKWVKQPKLVPGIKSEESIKADLLAKKITEEEAVKQLNGLGYK